MITEVYEDALSVYLCVFDNRCECVGIGRVMKSSRNAHEMFADLIEQLKKNPQACLDWREFEVPSLTYDRMMKRDCQRVCWLDEDNNPCMDANTDPDTRAIIGGSYADLYTDTGVPDCEDCRLSGMITED